MLHLTPSSALAWGNFSSKQDDEQWGAKYREATASKVLDNFDKAGLDPKETKLYLIGNQGIPTKNYYSGFSEENQQKKRQALAELLAARGAVVQVSKPLSGPTSTIYWNPDHSDQLLAVTGGQNNEEPEVVVIPLAFENKES